jgi:hypothetical protein
MGSVGRDSDGRERVWQFLDRRSAAAPDAILVGHAKAVLRNRHCLTSLKHFAEHIQTLAE